MLVRPSKGNTKRFFNRRYLSSIFNMVIQLFFIIVISLFLTVNTQTVEGPQHGKLVVCYMANWAFYLPAGGKFDIVDTRPALSMCTHVVYIFVGIDSSTNKIKSLDAYRDFASNFGQDGIAKLVNMKQTFPHLKVMVCLGGWNEGSEKYSRMVSSESTREVFINSTIDFLRENGLDGIEINWQFPGDRGGARVDKENFVKLIKEMDEKYKTYGFIVSVAVSSFPNRIHLGVNIPELSKYASHISVLSYEYHGFWDKKVGAGAPLKGDDDMNVENSINLLINQGADLNKLLLGITNYGMTFFLTETQDPDNVMGKPAKDFAFKGPYHNTDGFMGYNEICMVSDDGTWINKWDAASKTPYMVKEDRVVSYDNVQSIKEKVKFAVEKKLGGIMYYSLEKDDFGGDCSKNSSKNYPLLRAIHEGLSEDSFYEELLKLVQNHGSHFFWNGMRDS